jgi:RND superfamily putative drug exporter
VLANDPAYGLAVADITSRVARVPHVFAVRAPGAAGSVSRDGRSALVTLDLGNHGSIDRLLAATATAARAHPSLRIEEFGEASADKALSASLGRDFTKAETLSVPITLLILVLAFGALVAAGLPMLLGLTAVATTLGLIGVVSQWLPMDGSVSSVVLLIGLAVGVDYSLFYLRREREERAAGASRSEALNTAAATSGHAILVSGMTVMVAMAGMFFAGSGVFTSFAVGTILVVAIAMIGSLTVLPAMIAALGPRAEKGRVPLLHRLRGGGGGGSGAGGSGAGSRLWGAAALRDPPADARGRAQCSGAGGADLAGAEHADGAAGQQLAPSRLADRPDVSPDPDRLPRRLGPGDRRRAGG